MRPHPALYEKGQVRSWRARLLPSPASPEEEAALDEHLGGMVRLYGQGCAIVLNLLHLLFWPTDRLLLPRDEALQAVMHWFRASTFGVHALFLLLLRLGPLSARPLPLFASSAAVSAALFGGAMARLGGLDQPYFYMTYLAPLGLSAMPARPVRRFWLSPICGVVLCLAYFLTVPAHARSPRLGAALGGMAFTIAIGWAIGHVMYLQTRRAFLNGLALDRSRLLLQGYSEHLEGKVEGYALQLRRLAAHREQAASHERARLSRELHDEVGQQIASLRYTVTALRKKPDAGLLSELEQGLGQLGDAVRLLVSDLHPRVLQERGLGAALSSLVDRTAARTGLSCSLSLHEEPGVAVPEDLAAAAFRVVQESLTNALRHARPRSLRAALVVSAQGIEASVADDGCGMGPVDMTQAGMGLFGMSERAAALGGRLQVDSRPGAGTVVRLHLPLRGANAAAVRATG